MKRRRFLLNTAAAGLAASPLGSVLADDGSLQPTPRDYEGPYYPVGPRHRANDLITGRPRDTVLEFGGRVVDVHGAPLAGVIVDIWHTDPLGRYDHPRDTSPGDRWPDFLYWADTPTDDDGTFRFRTYVPGAYGRRPAHIHYKIWRDRRRLLTSQMYFRELGGARGASRSPSRSEQQTVALEPSGDGLRCFLQVVV